MTVPDEYSFQATWEATQIGPLGLSRLAHGASRVEMTPDAVRRAGPTDTMVALIAVEGRIVTAQNGREAVQRPGDVIIQDLEPGVISTDAAMTGLYVEVPRERLESVLGSARRYAVLTMPATQASTSLMTAYFDQLLRVKNQLSPDAAARAASIGIDLIVASVADRMALETPRSLQGTLVVQRAKAHVDANFSDPDLDPTKLATAVGVSLRRLQELFHADGRHISDWIWSRRLESAALRLSDPGCLHLSLGALAYGCGFANQAHFSRRFRDRFGLSPSEYRHAALTAAG